MIPAMASGPLRHAKRKGGRCTTSGQGLVEFSLVGGLFFFVVFSILNAGFFLYGRNAMQHAVDIGVATVAAEGDYDNPSDPAPNDADQVAITRMISAGLTTTPLVKVTEVDVYREIQQSDGSFVDDSSDATGVCGGNACDDRYTATGTVISKPWPIQDRNVVSSVGTGPDFAKLIVKYQYSLLVGNVTFSMQTNAIFRLEPQQ